ncbi:MAG: 50S ribosomal protein L18 [Proteobacteria bacterium]|nr:50S ribosomal protein L18 [Pseudomonadota bacterium]
MTSTLNLFQRRKQRVRSKLRSISGGKPRLSVFRSNQHVYAQVIDDLNGVTVASASTLDEEVQKALGKSSKSGIKAAKVVGEHVAKRAIAGKVGEVVFDRGGYLYHGRVKALADAAREAGLKF